MIVIGIVGSIYFGNLTELNTVIMSEGSRAIEFTISLAAIMALWMGIMNIILNMLGAGNGATSFGLKAMEELQTLNPKKDRASNEMILFLVINISSIQLIPFTMLKIRADAGSTNPNEIIISTLVATTVSTIVAIISCKLFERGNR